MITDTPAASVVQEFFEAINLRKVEHCQTLLQSLESLAQIDVSLVPWSTFLRGVLVFESQNNWSQAEQIFSALLRTELDPPLRRRVLYALGRTADRQGHWKAAVEYYEQFSVSIQESDQILEKMKAWRQIAICYCRGYIQGDFDSSALQAGVAYIQRAFDALAPIQQENTSSSIAWLVSSLWGTLGNLYRYLKQWDLAAVCYLQDLEICQQLNDRHGAGISCLNLGEIYHQRGRDFWSQALRHYKKARAIFQEYDNRYLAIDVLTNLGDLYRDMEQPRRALDRYRQAVRLIESLRTSISAEEARSAFFATLVNTYASLVKLYIDLGDIPQAFNLVERARSRSFIELLANQPVRPPQHIPQSLLNQEQQLRHQLQQLYTAVEPMTEQVTALEAALNELMRQMRLIDSEYVDLRAVRPLTYRQVQKRLPANTALISYFMADSNIFAFVVTHDALTVHHLPLSAKDLQRAFDENGYLVRMNLSADGRLREPWLLEPLYARLIRPLLDRLQGLKTLYILPYGPLHLVPFHALTAGTHAGQAQALLDNYQVVYAPSATVLVGFCQRKRKQAPQSLLAVGYNGHNLRHAEAEAQAIASLADGGVALVDNAATNQALFAQAQQFRWVHVACHGRFNPQAPLMSYLRLAGAPLYAADVLQHLHLQAELVTLGACETGRNRVLKGDELLGLVRAFIYAGTPAVLVSLWPVDELSTRILMERFYRELLTGQPKAEALRIAQQHLRRLTAHQVEAILAGYGESDPQAQVRRLADLAHGQKIQPEMVADAEIFAHPYFWAPFILVGDQL